MEGSNRIRTFREIDGTLHVECRFTFTPEELVGNDLSPSDRVFLQHFDRSDASLADRLQALSILVEAKARSAALPPAAAGP
jgi:hypothetical protein